MKSLERQSNDYIESLAKKVFIPFSKITETAHHECGIGKISFFHPDNKTLDKEIGNTILEWFNII